MKLNLDDSYNDKHLEMPRKKIKFASGEAQV